MTAASTAAISCHQGLVDAESTGRIEDHDVAGLALGGLDALACDLRDRRALGRAIDRDVELAAERLELVGGRRSIRVGRDEHRAAALLDDVSCELGGAGRLARTLEADHGDHRGVAAEVEDAIACPEQLHELVVDDLHDRLAGGQALQDVLPDGLLADAPHEVLDDLEVDVGLEQGEPHLAHGGIDIGFADPAATGQGAERRAQPLAEGVEHGRIRAPVVVVDRRSSRGRDG